MNPVAHRFEDGRVSPRRSTRPRYFVRTVAPALVVGLGLASVPGLGWAEGTETSTQTQAIIRARAEAAMKELEAEEAAEAAAAGALSADHADGSGATATSTSGARGATSASDPGPTEGRATEIELETELSTDGPGAAPPSEVNAGGTGAGQPEAEGGGSPLVGATAALVPETGRSYYLRGIAQLRMLAIGDEDPANDRSMLYSVEAGYKVIPRGALFVRLGLLQRFVAEEGESGFFLRDLAIGGKYSYEAGLAAIGLDEEKLLLTHALSFLLPTSRASANQDLYVAPVLANRVTYEVGGGLSVQGAFDVEYRFHEFAERAGLAGGLNRQLGLTTGLSLDYLVLQSDTLGAFNAGAELFTTWEKSYPSREEYESEASSQTYWSQGYGWGFSASWAPRDWLAATLSFEQNAPVLRDGIVNVRVPNRDESELVMTVAVQY